MKYKKRAQLENTIFFAIMMVGFMVCGGFLGVFIATVEKQAGTEITSVKMLLSGVLGLVLLYFAYMLQMYLHEIGHVLFGRMTGYRFSSIRFGKLMFVKTDGRIRIKKYSLPGTGGQALMLPPEGDVYDYPVFWYNAGGLVMNLVVSALGGVGYLLVPERLSSLKMFLMSLTLTGVVLFVSNALPFEAMGTDGANIRILRKDRNAKRVFRNIMEMANYLSSGCSLMEMPEALFLYEKEMKMDNPLVTSQAVNRFSYLVMKREFEEAYELGQYILEHAEAIHQLHELELRVELIYIMAVHKHAYEDAKREYHKEQKRLKRIASLISYQRSMYAYYLLAEPDEKKAADCKKAFENIARHYPYPEDARIERGLLEYADSCKEKM